MSDAILSKRSTNLQGQVFGRLTVLGYEGKNKHRRTMWRCQCACGQEIVADMNSLRTGNTRSCGCLHIDVVTTHGKSGGKKGAKSLEYTAWMGMIARCEWQDGPDWDKYGGRGITICTRFRSFENFFADMGTKPSPKHSIDRIDNDKGYWCGKSDCPDCGPQARELNCRWATRKMQDRNKRTNHLLTFRGETRCLTEWSEQLGIHPATLYRRLWQGMSVEEALTKPVRHRNKR